jgi:rhodanese-related sulfurtransferase
MHRGNISPTEAYQRLQGNSSAVLVDVRTQPEWTFVGVPAVERLVRLAWQVFPAMQVNAKFVEEIEQMGLPRMLKFSASAARARAHLRRQPPSLMPAIPIAGMWPRALRATRMPTATVA